MADSVVSEISGDEALGDFGGFDLVNINPNRGNDLHRIWNNLVGDSDDDDDSDFEGFEPEEAYVTPEFSDWEKRTKDREIHNFAERVGPTRVLDGSVQAIDYFKLFYSDVVLETIVGFTNLNAETKRAKGDKGAWTNVTAEEIMAFYGILILMDTMKFDRDELYWSRNEKHWLLGSKIGEVMSRDRYVQIKRYLHFSDDRCARDLANDKLHKVRFLLDHCRTFQAEYVPHKQITVDEAMIPFKGRLGMKQYMKDKPVKFGIKVWVLADAVTAYCYNFDVYIGKNAENVNKSLGLSTKVVIALTKPLEMKGYEVYTDNFYTSPQLADYLYGRKTYLCGTIRTNRKGYPRALVPTNAAARRLERGASDWLMCGPLLASCWKDKRMVYYLSSCHEPEDETLTTERRNKDGTAIQIPCTPTVQAYAQFMAGVDKLDQNTRLNKEKKTMRWYRRIEVKLRECAIYNAFLIEGTVIDQNPPHKRARDLLSFRMDLAHQLIGEFRQSRAAFKRPRSASNSDEMRLDERGHWPVGSGSEDRLCAVCNKKHKTYKSSHPGVSVRDNPWKRSKTTMMCEKCQVPLCCNSKSSCFRDYHTKVYFWQ